MKAGEDGDRTVEDAGPYGEDGMAFDGGSKPPPYGVTGGAFDYEGAGIARPEISQVAAKLFYASIHNMIF